jgi:hypothetical protein
MATAGTAEAGYRLTNVGVVFLRELSDVEYESLGRRIASHATATAWAIGDWLVAGSGRGPHGSAFTLAHQVTGRSYESLSQYARASAAFAHDDRDPRVPWSLYRELLRLPKADRVPTVRLIVANGWNRTGLVDYINLRIETPDRTTVAGAHESGLPTKRARGRPLGWSGRCAPKQTVRCPHCGEVFGVRRKGLTDTPIEADERKESDVRH